METKRLIIRQFKASDVQSCFENFGQDSSLGRFLIMFPMKDVGEMEKWIDGIVDNQNIWLIQEKSTMEPMGYVSIDIPYDVLKIGEIAYFLGEKFQRKGYASEALRCILEYLFNQRNLYLVEAKVNENNTASKYLLEKIGFKQDAILRGRRIDFESKERNALVIYSLLKRELKL